MKTVSNNIELVSSSQNIRVNRVLLKGEVLQRDSLGNIKMVLQQNRRTVAVALVNTERRSLLSLLKVFGLQFAGLGKGEVLTPATKLYFSERYPTAVRARTQADSIRIAFHQPGADAKTTEVAS